jgi:hypothetical protein
MKKLSTILFLLFCYYKVSATISIDIISPTVNQPSDSMLLVQVSTQSTYEITTVIASVNGKQISLVFDSLYSSDGDFNGNLSLSGLPKGVPLQLIIVATDFFNNQQADSVNFIYAPPPIVNIIYPIDESNAYPSLPIKAICTGVDTLTLKITVSISSQILFNSTSLNSIDTTISLSPVVPNGGSVYYTVTDKWGQQDIVYRNIFFDNNPYLTEIYSGTGSIFDFNYNKVLVATNPPQIIDINTKASTTITGNQAFIDNQQLSFLTPYGAIYGQNLNKQVFEWDTDSLYDVSGGFSSFGNYTNVRTAGKYATWIKASNEEPFPAQLYLRNLETHTDSLIASSVYEPSIPEGESFNNNDVAINGKVVYANPNNNFSEDPITDGYYVVDIEPSDTLYYYNIYSNGIYLSSLGPYEDPNSTPQSGTNYQVNNKYVTYSKYGTSGQLQIWVRDSTGADNQVTFFGSNSTIELLDSSGDVMFVNSGERYLANKGTLQPKDLGTDIGNSYYRDSSWYVVEGRYVYKLIVNAFITVADGNWSNPSTWENNIIPPAGADVIIRNNVVADTTVTINSLKVVQPASVTVLTGVNLTVLH